MAQALSVRQPWATLLLCGVKTIEIRRWPTERRGPVLLHAARIPDLRPEGWSLVPADHRSLTEHRGGIIGTLDLIETRTYETPEQFRTDRHRHCNALTWFHPPMFGFVFANPQPLQFRRCKGQIRFFDVQEAAPVRPPGEKRAALLVSVRSVHEAETALAAGADLIDIKEPTRGSLGRADDAVLTEVVRAVAGRRPVSAALGELRQSLALPLPSASAGLSYVKWGLAGFGTADLAWKMELLAGAAKLRRINPTCQWVAVAYADWQRARAPSPLDVAAFACAEGAGALLLDTWHKDGKTLQDFLPVPELSNLIARCQASGLPVALAGSLTGAAINQLRPLEPNWFAVRGAACLGGDRTAEIDAEAIRSLLGCI